MTSHRSQSAAWARAASVVALLLISLVALGDIALGATQQSGPAPLSAAERSWPEGVELLAAQELDLAAGDYQWQNSTLAAPPEDGELLEVRPAILIAVSGELLVEVNDVETIRLKTGAALPLQDEDEIVVTSASDDPAEYLLVELVNLDDAEPDNTENQVGPLTVPEGAFTMVLVNISADVNDDATAQRVIEDALRPGVSIAHTNEGIPTGIFPDMEYDRWIVALYPTGEPVATAELSDAPEAPEPTALPTLVPPVVATLPARPTAPPPTATSAATTIPPTPAVPTAPVLPSLAPTDPPVATESSPTDPPALTIPPIPTVPPVPTMAPLPTIPPIPTVAPVPTLPPLG
jgi:hypothetical protein